MREACTTIFLLLVFSLLGFLLRKNGVMLRSFLRTRKRRQRTRVVTVMVLVMAMLTGLVGLPERAEAAGYTWKVVNPGAKQEVVYIGKGRWDDQYYKLLTIEEAIAQGATDASRIYDIAGEHYVALIPRETYKDPFYQPIKVAKIVDGGDASYVADENDNRLILSGRCKATNVNFNSSPHHPISAKKVASVKVRGIKGYTKAPKKATLNALVLNDGHLDERNFVGFSSDAIRNWDGNIISCEDKANLFDLLPGYWQTISINLHNNSKTNFAKGVRIKCSKIPKSVKKGEIIKFKVTLSGSNLSQSPITNTIELVATEDVKITFSSKECFGFTGAPRAHEKKFFKNMFSKSGALIGKSTNFFENWSDFNGILEPDGTFGVDIVMTVKKA